MLTRPPFRLLIALAPMIILSLFSFRSAASEDKASDKALGAKARTFEFSYSALVTGLTPGQSARIWIPVPPTNEDQKAKIISKDLPGMEQISSEPKFGNQVLYVEGKADDRGKIPLSVTFRVTRREVRGDTHKPASDMDMLESYLKPDKRVPVGGKSLELIRDRDMP